MANVGIITQARMTSTRLPGKVLKTVAGKTLLEYHIERLKKSNFPIIIATTTNETDNPIADFCTKHSLNCFRGDEQNVLSRFYLAAKENNLDVVVRVTSDCPLIDGELIAKSVNAYIQKKTDWLYLSNCLKRTYPRGFDHEVFTFKMLSEAYEKSTDKFETEHVTPYFYQNKHGNTQFLSIEKNEDYSDIRLTVDEPDDFKLIEKVIANFGADKLNEQQICELLRKHPEVALINQHVEQKKV